MTPRLTTNCAKNYCNLTLIVKVIVENVVTCFLWGHARNVEKYIQWVTTRIAGNSGLCIYSFSCCCLQNLRNPSRFSQNFELIEVQGYPRSSI